MDFNKYPPIYTVSAGEFRTKDFIAYRANGKLVKVSVDPYKTFHSRDFGFFHSFEEAEKRVLSNYMDFHEMSYSIACISEVGPGIYTNSYMCKGRKEFYVWSKDGNRIDGSNDDEDSGYLKMDEPEDLKEYYDHVIGYLEPFG